MRKKWRAFVSKVKRLIQSYSKYIAVPWRSDAAAAQRVIFCVYNENEELRIRAKIDEFEIVTQQAGRDWAIFDLTDTFAQWLAMQPPGTATVSRLAKGDARSGSWSSRGEYP